MIAESFERTRPPKESVALLRADFRDSVANDVAQDDVQILDAETPEERYFRLRDEARDLVARGQLEEGFARAEDAEAVARELGDDSLAAMARSNLVAIAIELGRASAYIADLRAILMRNFDAHVSFFAAYNLARAYELEHNFKKSLFYARIASHRAEETGSRDFRARSRIQIGAALLGESHFEESESCLKEALAEMPDGLRQIAYSARLTLGYCKVVLGHLDHGFELLFGVLRELRRQNQNLPVFESWAHAYLSFAYLEKGRLKRAWIHAWRALHLAESTGDCDTIKTSLFLLGEIEASAGDTTAALEWFRQMQERFYPEYEDIPGLMARVGTLELVNFGA